MRIDVSEDQALWFRARRGCLVGEGAPSVTEAARAVVGLQAQVFEAALWAAAQRTAGRPTADEVTGALFGPGPATLVRTWGQRDTVHMYDARTHWARVVAARARWTQTGRMGPRLDDAALDRILEGVLRLGGTVTRDTLLGEVPEAYVSNPEVAAVAERSRIPVERFAAGRAVWSLSRRGDLCTGPRQGSAQTYLARRVAYPDLDWSEASQDALSACVGLTRDYLAVFGPATPHDVAHHFGARVGEGRAWVKALREAGALVEVRCGERKGLVALRDDVDALTAAPPEPGDTARWPVRLLAPYDTMLMGHRDKSWTVPEEAERARVWRRSAVVMGAVLERGRVVGAWRSKKRARSMQVRIEPLGGWHDGLLDALQDDIDAFGRHTTRPDVQVELVEAI